MTERRFLRLAIGLTGIGFLLYGIQREELSIIFNKAVNICLECIGIG